MWVSIHRGDKASGNTPNGKSPAVVSTQEQSIDNDEAPGATFGAVTAGTGAAAAYAVTTDKKDREQLHDETYEFLSSGTPSGVSKNPSEPSSAKQLAPSHEEMAKDVPAAAVGAGAGARPDGTTREKYESAPPTAARNAPPVDEAVMASELSSTLEATATKAAIPSNEIAPNFVPRPGDSSDKSGELFTVPETTAKATTVAAVRTAVQDSAKLGRDQSSIPGHCGTERSEYESNQRAAQLANRGQYNVLASGTPSGISIGTEKKNESATSVENTGKAVDPLMGATVPHPGMEDFAPENGKLPVEKQEQQASETVKDAPSQKTIHHCTECGAENDITSYFGRRSA